MERSEAMSRMGVLTKPRRPSNRRRVPERDVLRAVLDLLAVKRIWHRRMNTGAVKAEGRFFRFGSPGMSDVLVILRLRANVFWPLWLEVKTRSGIQNENQVLFEREVLAAGHSYLIVREVDELVAWLKERNL